MSLMGFLDDYIKVRKSPQPRHLLEEEELHHAGLSMLLAWWLVSATDVSETLSLTRATLPGLHMPWYVWVLWAGT